MFDDIACVYGPERNGIEIQSIRILQLCPTPPMPPADGGCVAINAITQGLLELGHDVKVTAIATPKHPLRRDCLSKSYLDRTNCDHQYSRYHGINRTSSVVPCGIQTELYKASSDRKSDTVIHIAAMDWLLNQEGIRWFLEEVWPRVVSAVPAAVLYIVGKAMPEWLFDLTGPDIQVLGEVPDAKKLMSEHPIIVVPLHLGSGVHINIIQGMANANAIIRTRTGASRVVCTPARDIIIADTEEKFSIKLISRLKQPSRSYEIGLQA